MMRIYLAALAVLGLGLAACGSTMVEPKPLRLASEVGRLDLTVMPNGEIRDTKSERLWARIDVKGQFVKMVTGSQEGREITLASDRRGIVWEKGGDVYRMLSADTFEVKGDHVLWNGQPWGTVSGYDGTDESRVRFVALLTIMALADPPEQ
jgi:hypothetical protein